MSMPGCCMKAPQPMIGASRDNDHENVVGNLDLGRHEPVFESVVLGEVEILEVLFE